MLSAKKIVRVSCPPLDDIDLSDDEAIKLRDVLNEWFPVDVSDMVTVLGRVCQQITDQSVYEFIRANPCSDGGDILEGLGYDITVEDGGAIEAAIDNLLEWKLIGADVEGGYSCTDGTFPNFHSDGQVASTFTLGLGYGLRLTGLQDNHDGSVTAWTTLTRR